MPEPSTESWTVPLAGGSLGLTWAEVTHKGRRRDGNQDAVLARYPLFAVADGMGGHIGGEIASSSTVERLAGVVAKGAVTPKTIEKALSRAVADISSHPEATDDGTLVRLTHHGLPDAESVVHQPHGWESYLPRLAIAATGGAPGPDPNANANMTL